MAALELSECVPMPIEQTREDFRFYFALLEFFVALFVARVVFAIRINRRHEHDVLSIGRPDPAIRAGRYVRHLMRLAGKRTGVGIKVAHPDLGRIGRFRRPDQPLPVRRKARPLLVIRRFTQSLRFTAIRRHDPQMRDLRVRLKIDIGRREHDPFPVRRRHRLVHAF